MRLPVLDRRDDITEALRANRPLVLKAPTGTGKSTQVPQIALDSGLFGGSLLVLEPRRLAARMLAARVASERGESPGETVGYQTRFESAIGDNTRIRFITEGILPRLALADPTLRDVSMVIFDEFHERSLTTDLGLALVRYIRMHARPDLRIVVMSATLERGLLEQFLPDAATIELQETLHPVDIQFAPPRPGEPVWESAFRAVSGLMEARHDGDILVFMPGAYEIRRTIDALGVGARERVMALPLYGDLAAHLQNRVMEQSDRRKVIVATNIAETSLTIPGVRHVVDSGLARVNRYDPIRGFNTLYVEPISRASAQQRSGRAGREGPGICVRLWSASNHDTRADRTQPEILRVDLAETVLYLRMLGFDDPLAFDWLERPPEIAVRDADSALHALGLVADDGAVTDDGALLASLPMHPRLGRLLVEAARRGSPREGALAAALLSERPVTIGKQPLRDRVDCTAASDFAALWELVEKVRGRAYDPQSCTSLNVNVSAVRQVVRMQAYYLQVLRRRRITVRDTASHRWDALGQAVLLAYPDRLARRRDSGTLLCELRDGRRGELSRESCVRKAQLLVVSEIRETRQARGEAPKTTLSLATEVSRDWLEALFPHSWREENALVWDSQRLAVESRRRVYCLGVLIEERAGDIGDTAAASDLLASKIIAQSLKLERFDTAAEQWIARVQWARERFPEAELPALDTSDRELVVHELCRGATRYSQVRDRPVLPLLYELVSDQGRRFVEKMAPVSVELPGGRTLRLSYKPGEPPRGSAKIQDLYGLARSPSVGGGRIPVLLEILAPNMRPVQVTDDLGRFWAVHYPEVKKSLQRRYPKHEWR